MPDFVLDTFTGTAGTLLQAHTGEIGATWTKNAVYASGGCTIDAQNRIYAAIFNAMYSASGTPPTPDYEVEADATPLPGYSLAGITARQNPTADTWILFYNDQSAAEWKIQVRVAGSVIVTAAAPGPVNVGQTYGMTLRVQGTQITASVDGQQIVATTSTALLTAFNAGVYFGETGGPIAGWHITNFRASEIATPTAHRALLPSQLTYCDYRPATATKLSKLTLWLMPRNVVLTDTAADEAWAYIRSATPEGLQF